jgi:bifunctional DNA-binding transcriptional regulator/antitoxin component of YhaV-PrlF toxin-antitoxin module
MFAKFVKSQAVEQTSDFRLIMADKQTFSCVLTKHDKLDAMGIEIPFDVEAVFGAKRAPVKAVIKGAEYRGSISRMSGKYMLGIPKEFRERAGIAAGDNIVITIEKDTTERTVETPADLAVALKDAGLEDAWDKLSYTHKKEHVRAIEEAKAADTRTRRINKAIEMIVGKKK